MWGAHASCSALWTASNDVTSEASRTSHSCCSGVKQLKCASASLLPRTDTQVFLCIIVLTSQHRNVCRSSFHASVAQSAIPRLRCFGRNKMKGVHFDPNIWQQRYLLIIEAVTATCSSEDKHGASLDSHTLSVVSAVSDPS